MTDTSDSDLNNTSPSRSIRRSAWKLIPLSILMCAVISLFAFGLRAVMFDKGEIGEFILTLAISILTPVLIGVRLISKKRKNIGWACVIGAGLALVFWFAAFYSLAKQR